MDNFTQQPMVYRPDEGSLSLADHRVWVEYAGSQEEHDRLPGMIAARWNAVADAFAVATAARSIEQAIRANTEVARILAAALAPHVLTTAPPDPSSGAISASTRG